MLVYSNESRLTLILISQDSARVLLLMVSLYDLARGEETGMYQKIFRDLCGKWVFAGMR